MSSPHLLLGVCGGIAAYKAADLTSQALKAGWEVRVVMTRGAVRFVGPITFEALSGHPVMTAAIETGASPDGVSSIDHISWAKWADVAIVAPLTASTLGKLACGIADDALTTVLMALRAGTPTLICPASRLSRPPMAFNRVVFPDPDGPKKALKSPGATTTDTSTAPMAPLS